MDVSKTSTTSGSNPFKSNNDESLRPKQKSWKDDHSEQRHDNWYQRRDDSERLNIEGRNDQFNRDGRSNQFVRGGGNKPFNRDGGNKPFNRDRGGNNFFNRDTGNERFNRGSGSDRFNRDGPRNDRNNYRDGGRYNQFSQNDSKDDRNCGSRFALGKRDQGFTTEKYSVSDNESTTSSRGSGGKRGERGGFQGRKERDNKFGRFNRFGNKDNETDGFRSKENNSGNAFKSRNFRDDSFQKPKEMINLDTNFDFLEPKKFHIPLPNITIGGTNECELVYLTNPSNFYIHLIPENLKLDELMERIAAVYETGGTILDFSKVNADVACIAQYSEDEKWYRAIIKSIEDTNVAKVLFVDFGNIEIVNFDKLKEINEEFTQLPIQAVHCKLFGPKKTEWSTEEIESFGEATNGKYLQAEFVMKEKDIYEVLLCEMENGVAMSAIINESFCQNESLMKAKEAFRNTEEVINGSFQKNQPEYASLDSRWIEEKVSPGKTEVVLVTWFDNPDSIYCQSISKQKEFRPMMEEIQKVYVRRQHVSDALEPGCPVIAIFDHDQALYRAEIVKVNADRNHVVQYVDFGNKASVNQCNMYPVEKRFMLLPKQGILCSLMNIIPTNGGNWSNVNSHEIEKFLFEVDEFDCTYHEKKDGRYLVSLSNKGEDVSNYLVERKFARFNIDENATEDSPVTFSTPRFDINLLPGQVLRGKISSVESVSKFYLRFLTAEDCDKMISSYMANKDPQVMPRLSSFEMCLGAGCLIFTAGVWRRAVVINCSESRRFEVRLIDTGAYSKVSLDCMLALPSQLSVMQNQAIECCLLNVQPSSSLNEKLKKLVENQNVIVHIDDVDNDRLIVQLYDSSGRKIQLSGSDSETKISPICRMPILSSTHKVNVSCANHSNSLWLQMSSDAEIDEKLNREMAEFYSEGRESIIPEPNKLCAVKNQDGTYSRAIIMRKTDSGAFVNLIDYGMNEDVPINNLKALDPRFFIPHQLAIHVSLNVTLRDTAAQQVKILKPYLQGKEFTATFYNVHEEWVVELVENGVKLSETLTSLNLVKESTDITKGTQKTNMEDKFKAIISHTDSPTQFWIQRFDEIAALEELQNELQNSISDCLGVHNVLEEGSLCAVISDEIWYRAEVIDADEDITTVRFIDYGKTDIITNEAGNIKELPNSIKSKKIFGIKCRFDVIPVDSEDWSDTTCKWLQTLFKSQNHLEAVFISDCIPKRVDLFIDGKSVVDILVEKGHAVKVLHEEEVVEEIVEVELDPRSAFISHIYSPNEFFVQEEKSISDLEKIQDRFLVADMLPKLNDITENLLCVAKFTDNDWYRARVISHNEEGIKVLFIDYGNSAVVTEIRAIPEDVASIPPLSRKCSLQIPNYISHWPGNALENFCELAADGATIFLMDIVKEGETTIVKLILENEDIAEKLAPPRSIFISHINSLSDFWVQEEKTLFELENLQERLKSAENYPLVEIKEGLFCVAKFSDDEQWYRAKVLLQNGNETVVLFVDYGNSATSTEIRSLPEDLMDVPSFAKNCSLHLPLHIAEKPQDAFNNFYVLAENENFTFFLDVIEEKECAVVNLFSGKENIIERLAPKKEKSVEEESTVSEVKSTLSEKQSNVCETDNETACEKYTVISEVPVRKATLISVYISQLSSPSEFWVQEEKAVDDIFNMEELLVNADKFPLLSEAKEGMTCIAKFPFDSSWYRAKVLSQNEKEIVVFFIDYGNSSVVTDLRIIPEDVAVIPALAKKCCLQMPQNIQQWSQEALSEFLKLSSNGITCFSMDVLEDGDTAIVNLYLNGDNISEQLVSCSPHEVFDKDNIIPESESVFPEKNAILADDSLDIKKNEPTFDEINSKLVPISVFISHFNSSMEFWIHEEKSAEKLQKIAERLLNIEKHQQVEEPEENLICATPIDDVWKRAKIVSHNEKETIVFLIDYGNSSVVTELWPLPQDLTTVPPLAKKCCLKLPLNFIEWPEEVCNEFRKLSVDGTSFLMHILEEGDPAIVDLKLNEESVVDKLLLSVSQKLAEKETAVIERKDMKSPNKEEILYTTVVEGTEENVNSTILLWHVISPSEFWGQIGNDSAHVQDKLLYANEWPLIKNVNEGMICAAKENEKWYRARVQSINEEGIQVLLIDQGYILICAELRELPSDLVSEPPFSKRYSLKLPDNVNEWSQAATAAFSKYTLTSFSMEVLEDGEIPVIKLFHHGEDVSEILASMVDDFSNEIIERLPPEGEENLNMTISHVISPSIFWGQTEIVMPKLDAMVERLKDAGSLNPVKNFNVGRICAAKFSEDGLWYRGRILSHSTEGTEVFYVDYGNATMTKELRVLPLDVVNIEYLSTQYTLRKPTDVEEWSKEAHEKFQELVADGATMFQYNILDLEKKEIELIYQNMDVAEMLTPLCKKSNKDNSKLEYEALEEEKIEPKSIETINLINESDTEILPKDNSEEKQAESKSIETIDLNGKSDPDIPLEEKTDEKRIIQKSPDSAFNFKVDSVTEKIDYSSHLSHEPEPTAFSCIVENKDVKDFLPCSQEFDHGYVGSTVSFFTDSQTSAVKGELTVDDIMERMTCEPEEEIESSCHQEQEVTEKESFESHESCESSCDKTEVPKQLDHDTIEISNVSQEPTKTENIHNSIIRRKSIPYEDKITPGSVSGYEERSESDSECFNKSGVIKSSSVPELSSLCSSNISLDNRIVSVSSISSDDILSVVTSSMPQIQSEKIVADTGSFQEKSIEAEKN